MTETIKDYEEFLTPEDFKRIGEEVPENLADINGHPEGDASKFFSSEENEETVVETKDKPEPEKDDVVIGKTKDGKPIYKQERYEEVLGGGIPARH